MKFNDMLERVQIELMADDPTENRDLFHGRILKNKTDGHLKIANDSHGLVNFLLNDQNLKIGTSETDSENVRLNRASVGVLQFLPANDTTEEGNLSTTLAQLSYRSENLGEEELPSAGNAGRLIFVTDGPTLFIDNGADIHPLTDLSTMAASRHNRLVLSKDLRMNLNLLPRKEAAIYYSQDQKKLVIDDGVELIEVGHGGGGGGPNDYVVIADLLEDQDGAPIDGAQWPLESFGEMGAIHIIYSFHGKRILNGYVNKFYNSRVRNVEADGYYTYVFGGPIRAVIELSDGRILVGGGFIDSSTSSNYQCRHLRMHMADGAIFPSNDAFNFNVNACHAAKFSNDVTCLAEQADGKILVGGLFDDYFVSGYNKFIRLNVDGTLDNVFTANSSDSTAFGAGGSAGVYDIKVLPDGKILVAGNFTDYGGTTGRSYLIKLNSDGTTDTAWTANVDGKFNGPIMSLCVQTDGKILVGGQFSNYEGLSSYDNVIRLNPDGTHDDSFVLNEQVSNVNEVKVQPDGKVLVCTSTSGPGLWRFDSIGQADVAFNAVNGGPLAGRSAQTVLIDGDFLIVGGQFSDWADGGFTDVNGVVRLNISDGSVDSQWSYNALHSKDYGTHHNHTVYAVLKKHNDDSRRGGGYVLGGSIEGITDPGYQGTIGLAFIEKDGWTERNYTAAAIYTINIYKNNHGTSTNQYNGYANNGDYYTCEISSGSTTHRAGDDALTMDADIESGNVRLLYGFSVTLQSPANYESSLHMKVKVKANEVK